MRRCGALRACVSSPAERAPCAWQEEGCRPGNVYATEDETQWTKLTIEVRTAWQLWACTTCRGCMNASAPPAQVADFPGLVRVIAWVLNGAARRARGRDASAVTPLPLQA